MFLLFQCSPFGSPLYSHMVILPHLKYVNGHLHKFVHDENFRFRVDAFVDIDAIVNIDAFVDILLIVSDVKEPDVAIV